MPAAPIDHRRTGTPVREGKLRLAEQETLMASLPLPALTQPSGNFASSEASAMVGGHSNKVGQRCR